MKQLCDVCGETGAHAYMCTASSSRDRVTNMAEGLEYELRCIISDLGDAQLTEHFKDCVRRIDETLERMKTDGRK